MTLTDLKNRKLESGFTIVELLIVIVVIAILAALVLTAYTGVQQRARDSSRASDVRSIATAAEAYRAENTAYPTLAQVQAATTVKLDAGVSAKMQTTPAPDATTNVDKYQYIKCTTDGAQIKWWKEETGALQTRSLGTTTTCP
jgi:prepilin-type N-terminal cleavage/methylation domain-containing protein